MGRVDRNLSWQLTCTEAFGTIDELNATLGLTITTIPAEQEPLIQRLRQIQQDLAWLRALLARPKWNGTEADLDRAIHRLEGWIDEIDGQLPPLRHFILPGGTVTAAWLHMARTICRRAERRVVAMLDQTNAPMGIIGYLNRLSDLLFVMARWANKKAGRAETTWHAPPKSPQNER